MACTVDILDKSRNIFILMDSQAAVNALNDYQIHSELVRDCCQYLVQKVVGLERGLLSLLSTTEELLDRKVAAPV
jgi:hypothetical protein